MMTPFEAALQNFEAYCWTELGPDVGERVSDIIQRDYVDQTGRGFGGLGDAWTDIGETSTPQDYLPGTFGDTSSPAVNTVNSLTDFLSNFSSGVLKTAQTYITTKSQLDTLKLQAQQQQQQPRQLTSADLKAGGVTSMVMLAGVGLVAALVLSRPSAGGGRR